ncbi:hypothetical protein C8J57DRAFT_1476256 [Mycena rebaudengoi]|nr:hypothetical protein C8J57DRAFT_1476256 [Mycena rebaudengoi]
MTVVGLPKHHDVAFDYKALEKRERAGEGFKIKDYIVQCQELHASPLCGVCVKSNTRPKFTSGKDDVPPGATDSSQPQIVVSNGSPYAIQDKFRCPVKKYNRHNFWGDSEDPRRQLGLDASDRMLDFGDAAPFVQLAGVTYVVRQHIVACLAVARLAHLPPKLVAPFACKHFVSRELHVWCGRRQVAGDDEAVPVLLLLGIRLDSVNPVYYGTIKMLYTFPQSVGIAGGRPSSSYYFVSVQGDGLFYLDPHHSRPAVPLRSPPTPSSAFLSSAPEPSRVASRVPRAAGLCAHGPPADDGGRARAQCAAGGGQARGRRERDDARRSTCARTRPRSCARSTAKRRSGWILIALLPRTIFATHDEPPTWLGADDDDERGMESISDPEEDVSFFAKGSSSASPGVSSNSSHAPEAGVTGGGQPQRADEREREHQRNVTVSPPPPAQGCSEGSACIPSARVTGGGRRRRRFAYTTYS